MAEIKNHNIGLIKAETTVSKVVFLRCIDGLAERYLTVSVSDFMIARMSPKLCRFSLNRQIATRTSRDYSLRYRSQKVLLFL